MIVYQTVITDNMENIVCKDVSGDFAPPCFKGHKIITASQITVSQFYYEAYFCADASEESKNVSKNFYYYIYNMYIIYK